MSIIVQGMTELLKWLYNLTSSIGLANYGIAIILLTIIIKTLIYPLTLKQMSSMRKTVELQPKVKEIQKKHKNDPQKANAEIMELYKENKVNPAGGCLPLLIQLPIFWGLYSALLNFKYEGAESAVMFLGFNLTHVYGFSSIPHLILPLFAAATTYLQTKVTSPNASSDPTQKTMLYIMPIFFGYISATVPSGLALYWVTMNIVSIVQMVYINRKFSNENAKSA
ncbi:MAG: YidC/Oxa1 family membrane protein insertase [Desulfitobacterium hafniense]|nr:YidC/Oxa1 family membrane protein insertase [Desulfitobacterium hafniense]